MYAYRKGSEYNEFWRIPYGYPQQKSISRKDLAEQLGIPYTTLRNYETDQREPGHKILIKLATILNVSVDTLVGHCVEPVASLIDPNLTNDEQQLIDDYRSLNDRGQELVRQQMELVVISDKYKKYAHFSNVEKQA